MDFRNDLLGIIMDYSKIYSKLQGRGKTMNDQSIILVIEKMYFGSYKGITTLQYI